MDSRNSTLDSFFANRPSGVDPRQLSLNQSPTRSMQSDAAPIDPDFSTQQESPPQPVASKAKKPKTASETYQKLSQLEHVIKRPDTYIGSVEVQQSELWVLEGKRMVYKTVNIVPGFYKIFDEILVNAADNKIRDSTMDTIKVTIDRPTNTISVWNNGSGIPVQVHEKEKIYIPELIFGHLLTSSNYDDNEAKVTGGRNGYGAKLCNIFSTEFTVETSDKTSGHRFKQTFSNNMGKKSAPKVTKAAAKDFTCISFKPDLAKFGMKEIDDDHEALLKKRVYDLAGCVPKVKVFLNNERIDIKSFGEYVKMYLLKPGQELAPPPAKKAKKSEPTLQVQSTAQSNENIEDVDMLANEESAVDIPVKTEDVLMDGNFATKSEFLLITDNDKSGKNERWEVIVTASDGQFQQISFVNSICTAKGGTHVDYVTNQIVNKLAEKLKSRNKNASAGIKNHLVKQQIWVFINCLVNNPAFDSQTKEYMTLKSSSFGSKWTPSDKFMDKIYKSPISESIMSFVRFRQDQSLKKTDGTKRTRLSGIDKLDDANNAGSRNANKCTLILTEGDSAKALAISGLSVVGRDNYGVFPLRGKLLNVREASAKQVSDNAELNNVKRILGLQHGKEYIDVSSLRYGHLMIMTDQDHDGSHIKGLIINFLDYYYPSLLKIPGFLTEFITPIVKATKGNKEISFYTMPEYEQWKELNEQGKGWKVKYYKGLGTSTSADAKKYFSAVDRHRKVFSTMKATEHELIDMAFNKKRADHRKEWLRRLEPGTYMDHTVKEITIEDFINRELILFSQADNVRSIPSMVDGMKPGQRKIIFSCFKRNLRAEIKVQQLAGYVSEHSAYHHGEASLQATIVNLAQDFIGSNNINLLMPNGQFGSRNEGGKDAASARYIFTNMSRIARKLFQAEDDPLLTYLHDDGLPIEPEWYIPIIPMVLVNGSEGIGTGWSTSIPCYNPEEIVENIRRKMRGESMKEMMPWYRGFKGKIEPEGVGKFKVEGIINKIDDETLEITELPVGFWTQAYKVFLESMEVGTDKTPAFIRRYDANHTDVTVHFVVYLSQENMAKAEVEGLEKKFKLIRSISTTNMVCHDSHGRLRKFSSPLEIIEDFYPLRFGHYTKRKEMLVNKYMEQVEEYSERVRFVEEIISGQLIIQNRKRKDIVVDLKKKKYKMFHVKKAKEIVAGVDEEDPEKLLEEEKDETNGYNYLLNMPLWSLTWEKVEQLKKERDETQKLLDILLSKDEKDLWTEDLDAFMQEYEKIQKEYFNDMEKAKPLKKAKINKPRAKKVTKKGIITERETAVREASTVDIDDISASTPQKRKREDEIKDEIKEEESLIDKYIVKSKKTGTAAPRKNTTIKGEKAKKKNEIDEEEDFDMDDVVVPTAASSRPKRAIARISMKEEVEEEIKEDSDYIDED